MFLMVSFLENKIASEMCCFGEMTVNYYQTTWHHIPKESTYHSHPCLDLNSLSLIRYTGIIISVNL
jgi:hypothetical protein